MNLSNQQPDPFKSAYEQGLKDGQHDSKEAIDKFNSDTKLLVEALKNISSSCDPQNNDHYCFYSIAQDALSKIV